MANIILINDQDQEQTLSGVSKLVTRSTGGEAVFSTGGQGGGETVISGTSGGGTISAPAETAATPAKVAALVETEGGTKFFKGTTIYICDNKIGVTTNALDWTDPDNFDKFSANEAGTWTHENTTKITGSVESWYDEAIRAMVPAKTAITLQNLSDNEAVVFSFNYREEYSGFSQCRGYVKIGSEDATTGNGTYSVALQPKQSISVLISTTQYNREVAESAIPRETVELSSFACLPLSVGSVKLSASKYGSYTVQTGSGEQTKTVSVSMADLRGNFTVTDGSTITHCNPDNLFDFQFVSTDGLTVDATAEGGYNFYLWQATIGGKNIVLPETTDGESTKIFPEYGGIVCPVFIGSTQGYPIFSVGDKHYYYWDDAMQAARNANDKTAMAYSMTLPTSEADAGRYGTYAVADSSGRMSYTVPAGVTITLVELSAITIPAGVSLATYSGRPLDIKATIQCISG